MIQSRFRSRSEHVLDDKGRLNFPSRFRDVLRQYESEILMVTSWGKHHLRAFPLSVWEILENKLLTEGRGQEGIASFVRYVVGGVTECTLDKQGRILLPQSLRADANLRKDVVLTGMLDWIEIWDKEAWLRENETTRDGFEAFDQSLARLGIF
jgi:MraZ protein